MKSIKGYLKRTIMTETSLGQKTNLSQQTIVETGDRSANLLKQKQSIKTQDSLDKRVLTQHVAKSRLRIKTLETKKVLDVIQLRQNSLKTNCRETKKLRQNTAKTESSWDTKS